MKIRGSALCLAAISLMYFFCAGLRAAYRPFWFDELITWHAAGLPGASAIWSAMLKGADQQMPLSNLSVHYSQAVFGTGLLATRLPALIGFWVMLMGIYVFLRRRLPLPYALIGTVFPMLTFAWAYAFEARAYGMMLGGAAVALVSWQAAAEGTRRTLALIGITAGLAVALGSNQVALTLAASLAVGELVRTRERRRWDLPVWIAFAAGGLVTLIYPTVLAITRDWNLESLRASPLEISNFYSTFLKGAVTPLIIAGGAAYCLGDLLDRYHKPETVATSLLPPHEAAAMIALAASPAMLLSIGLVSKHFFFFTRHGMLSAIGLAVWVSVLLYRCAGGRQRVGWLMLLAMTAWLTAARAKEAVALAHDPVQEFRERYALLFDAVADGRPIVVSSNHAFLPADFYLPADAAGRLYYVVDREAARGFGGQDLSDQGVMAVARSFPLRAHVLPWKDFAARQEPFLLYKSSDVDWLGGVLIQTGWHVNLKAVGEEQVLYEVNPPKRESPR